MDNTNRIAGPVAIAVVLAGSGLSYAHLRLESLCWTISVLADSVWRLVAANLALNGISLWTGLGVAAVAALCILVPAEERKTKSGSTRNRAGSGAINHD
jgi:hypothetical protein